VGRRVSSDWAGLSRAPVTSSRSPIRTLDGLRHEFTAQISATYGGQVFDDLMKVTDELAKLPYVMQPHGRHGLVVRGYMMTVQAIRTASKPSPP